MKEDEQLLLHVREVDLIAKEFTMHKPCYNNYVRHLTKKAHDQKEASEHQREVGDFSAVKEVIQSAILSNNQALSITALHRLYKVGYGSQFERSYRAKLKKRIMDEFDDALIFLKIDNATPEVVASSAGLEATTIVNDKERILKLAAEHLRNDIMAYASTLDELVWPPNSETLSSSKRDPPPSATSFFTHLLKSKGHNITNTTKRLIDSYTTDMIHSVTRGKVITLKHFLLGVDLHNLTGLKLPIKILSHLGHSIDYNVVCEIETAEAELAMMRLSLNDDMQQNPTGEKCLKFWWADNFNQKLETLTGHGVIDSTHIVEFSEPGETEVHEESVSLPRTKRRSLQTVPADMPEVRIDKKKEPVTVSDEVSDKNSCDFLQATFAEFYRKWMLSRIVSSTDQIVPNFSGFFVKSAGKADDLQKTKLTYLPPINASITAHSTIYKVFEMILSRANQVQLPYANITFDVGAAINAHKVLWNYPERFKNIIIHLGDFHFMKEMFTVLGNIVCGSGFEDIVFQANICSTGSLNGVLAGSHYNRCWTVHSTFAEALERLLFKRFSSIHGLPDVVKEAKSCSSVSGEEIERLLSDAEVIKLLEEYGDFKESVRKGNHGMTPQFWLVHYLDIMPNQHLLHSAIQSNNFSLRLHGLKTALPFLFALNKQNYARYGAIYVNTLENLERTHPGCKELLSEKGLSVQGQDRYKCRIAIDQRGEQTINKDAKVSGGIKYFASDENAILKWTLNRPMEAKNTNALMELADVKSSDEAYKSNRPSQILKSEKFVENIMNVMTEEYINPFDESLEKDCLYNLSSGIQVESEIAYEISQVKSKGDAQYNEFVKNRIKSTDVPIHDPIKRNKLLLFKNASKKVEVKYDCKKSLVEVNRNILAKVLAHSAKTGRTINFQAALAYPLSSVPLAFANPDGSRRVTKKSQLMEIVLSYSEQETMHESNLIPKEATAAYIVDLVALIRSLPGVSDTYRELTQRIVDTLPTCYARVDIVADTYRKDSLKNSERLKRGHSAKVLINSAVSKLPRNFSDFLKNGENKGRMIEIIKDEMVRQKHTFLEKLKCSEIMFSVDKVCIHMTESSTDVIRELSSNQEEADTKLLLHAKDAFNAHPGKAIFIRSPSGDVDINILFLGLFPEDPDRIYIDYGTGKSRKVFQLSMIDMPETLKSALVGFHAFSGNDYISSIFRKSKLICWKKIEKSKKFTEMFVQLGNQWRIDGALQALLEEYVCALFMKGKRDINEVRYEMFKNIYEKKGRIQDLSLLPPCRESLNLRSQRCNYIAKAWKSSFQSTIDFDVITANGWSEEGQVIWMNEAFPPNVTEILMDAEEGSDSDEALDGESDSDYHSD